MGYFSKTYPYANVHIYFRHSTMLHRFPAWDVASREMGTLSGSELVTTSETQTEREVKASVFPFIRHTAAYPRLWGALRRNIPPRQRHHSEMSSHQLRHPHRSGELSKRYGSLLHQLSVSEILFLFPSSRPPSVFSFLARLLLSIAASSFPSSITFKSFWNQCPAV